LAPRTERLQRRAFRCALGVDPARLNHGTRGNRRLNGRPMVRFSGLPDRPQQRCTGILLSGHYINFAERIELGATARAARPTAYE
jgi:hypothetical protein